jgi:prolactin regulatory element-binding protein
MFTPPTDTNARKEAYQRLIRLSPSKPTAGHKRIGAITSSLAGGNANQLVLFDASVVPPPSVGQIALPKGGEVNDVDILEPKDGNFKIAYCTDYEVYIKDLHYDFGQKKFLGVPETPRKTFSVPSPDVGPKQKGRPKLRCIRWLSPEHILLLINLPGRTGVELQVLRVPSTPSIGSISTRKRLPSHVVAAVDMDVCWLDKDGAGDYQIVVAVGGVDISLVVLTVDYKAYALGSLHQYAVYRDVHEIQMTKVALSPFFSPWTSVESSPAKRPGRQWLRLASTSLGNTISVETFELHPVSSAANSRYQLSSSSSRYMAKGATYTVIAIVIAVVALLLQSMLDPEGNLTNSLVPSSLRNSAGISPPGALGDEVRFAGARIVPDAIKTPVIKTSQRIQDLLHLHRHDEEKALIIHHGPEDSSLSTEVHADPEEVVKKHTEAKKWEDLSRAEQKRWKEKLSDAGMWAVDEGETILKGIFFGQIGGLVGQVAQGVIG